MAHVYENNFSEQGEDAPIMCEASKLDDIDHLEMESPRSHSLKSSIAESSKKSNVIKVNAQDIISQNDEISQDSNMEGEDEGHLSPDRDQDDDEQSKENEQSNDGSTGNGLRRSKRMAGNNNSYGLYKRRSFKYDDEFEYSGHMAHKKGTIEMDPPELGSQGKRKRKNTTLISVPYSDGTDRYVIIII